MRNKLSSVDAENYVRGLFLYVLNRQNPSDKELTGWVDYLLIHQDYTDLLHRFGNCEERKRLIENLETTRTAFPSGHFYSPIVDPSQVERDADRVFGPRHLVGVDLNIVEQILTFKGLAQYLQTMPFKDEKAEGLRYYYNNTSYGFGDAFTYWGMIAERRPRRIIEIGSGFTSALALDAIEQMKLETCCTFIDPYPALLNQVASPIKPPHNVVSDRVQAVDLNIIRQLGHGDILFIDSSHVVKTGSDVHFELTEILPQLSRGVLVHFHDVFNRFEYPRSWIIKERQSWNELYFLHVFLMYNKEFKIVYFNDFFARELSHHLKVLTDSDRRRIQENPGGGLWLVKV
jgi:hypothetical protein